MQPFDPARAARRQTLAIRTITITLRSALDALSADSGSLTPADRGALRREWCERARIALQVVQAEIMRQRALTAAGKIRPPAPEMDDAAHTVDAAAGDAEAYIGRLERAG